jgi:hypothetical protein
MADTVRQYTERNGGHVEFNLSGVPNQLLSGVEFLQALRLIHLRAAVFTPR